MTYRAPIARYKTVVWLTLAAALAYLCRTALSVAESTVRKDLGLSEGESGWVLSAFFWTYAVCQIPTGWFAQRVGTRIALTIFAVAWSTATFGIGIAPGLIVLIVVQLIMGVAQSGIFPAACNSVGHWMPMSQRSMACGFLNVGMQVGAIAAGGLMGLLLLPLGWRTVFIVFSIPSFIWAIGFYIRFRDQPDQLVGINPDELALIRADQPTVIEKVVAATSEQEKTPKPKAQNLWLAVLCNSAIWFLCGQQMCRAAGYLFFTSWFPSFLQKTHNVPIDESGYLQALVLTGALAGGLLGGFLGDAVWKRTKNLRLSRSGIGATCMAICALLFFIAWSVENTIFVVGLLATASLFSALAGPASYTSAIDIGGKYVPQVFGLMNMCGNLAAASTPILVGWLFEVTDDWNVVLLVFAGIQLTSAICWACMNPNKKIFTD